MTRIAGLSYDLAGRERTLETVMSKLARDGRAEADFFFVVCGRTKRSFSLSPSLRGAYFAPPFWFRPLCDLLFVWHAPRMLAEARFAPEEILISDFPLAFAAAAARRRLGGKIVLQLNGLPSQLAETRSLLHRIYYIFSERIARRMVDRYVAINGATREYLLRLGIPASKITVRPPDTISPDLPVIAAVQKGEARRRFGIGEHERFVLSVGRLEPEKAFDELINVFMQSKVDARLVLAGEGRLRKALEAQIQTLGAEGRVMLAGQQDRKALWECYKDADAFVLISKSEALGMAVWEAMYAGVPVIGRPTGGIQESIGKDGERGFLWDSTDGATTFAQKLGRAFNRDAVVSAMVERARIYVREKLSL